MSTFPIKCQKLTMDHRGGTKSYHLLQLTNTDGEAILVKRWGKTGAFGQMDVRRGNAHDMASLWNAIHREKTSGLKGYEPGEIKGFNAMTEDELKKFVTVPLWTKLGADNIKHVIPEASAIGVKDPEVIEWGEDGKPVPKKPLEMPDTENRTKTNPNWGMF